MLLALERSAETAYDDLCRQLAFRAASDDVSFDVVVLAYSLITYTTISRLQQTGVLAKFSQAQQSGVLRWSALDWTLGAALDAIGVPPRGHGAFQQHVSSGCKLSKHVACHPVSKEDGVRLMAQPFRPPTGAAAIERWARPCRPGRFPSCACRSR